VGFVMGYSLLVAMGYVEKERKRINSFLLKRQRIKIKSSEIYKILRHLAEIFSNSDKNFSTGF
jgi:hypothetical protein